MLTSSFGGLWFKEWKMARPFHLIGGIGSLLVILISFYFFGKWDEAAVFFPLMIWSILHVFYLPGYMLASLSLESKQLHLWLHNPSSIYQLLFVKILQGLMFAVLSFMIFSSILYLQLSHFDALKDFMPDILNLYGIVSIHLLLGTITLSIIIILLWSIHQYLKNHIGKWSFLVLIFGIVLGSKIISWIEQTAIYQALTQWGGIEIPLENVIPNILQLAESSEQIQLEVSISGGNTLFIGQYIVSTLIVLGTFLLASWILERKVEV